MKKYSDEWYTQYEDIELLDKKINLDRNKHYELICDTKQSNIYKYFKDNNFKFNHSHTDFNNYVASENSIILTNPPFSLINDFINKFTDNEIIILIPTNRLTYTTTLRAIENRLITVYFTHTKPMIFYNNKGEALKLLCCWIHLSKK